MLLKDEEIDENLAAHGVRATSFWGAKAAVKEAIRVTAIRCAEEVEKLYPARAGTFNGMTVQKCAAAIRRRAK